MYESIDTTREVADLLCVSDFHSQSVVLGTMYGIQHSVMSVRAAQDDLKLVCC